MLSGVFGWRTASGSPEGFSVSNRTGRCFVACRRNLDGQLLTSERSKAADPAVIGTVLEIFPEHSTPEQDTNPWPRQTQDTSFLMGLSLDSLPTRVCPAPSSPSVFRSLEIYSLQES